MHKIIIDGKEIEISDESYQNLKKSLLPKKFKWNYLRRETYLIDKTRIYERYNGDAFDLIEHGRYRKTKEVAEQSLLRNKQANRLEALVEQIQGNLEGDYIIYYDTLSPHWHYRSLSNHIFYPGIIVMRESTARKVCEMLNNGEFSLEGEL